MQEHAMGKGLKTLVLYLGILLGCGIGVYGLIRLGNRLETVLPAVTHPANVSQFFSKGLDLFTRSLSEHIHTPVATLLLQVIAILFIARIFGSLFVKIGQPSVVGEILAGIVLGPSILGNFLPGVSDFLFAPETLGNITILSQIGLIFFMFVIGMELDIEEVRKTFKKTILISHTGIFFPFLCGVALAYFTYPYYASQTTAFLSYALFTGISMSITAFPVLARIIQEKRLTKSHLGTLSLASAASGDVLAWCLLAVIIAITQTGTLSGAIYAILFTALYIVFMFFVLRPFLNIIGNLYHNKEVLNKAIVASMFLILISSAYLTELLGIHALFGAFVAGVAMPSHIQFRKILTEKVEDVALTIFLPLFFVSTGLKTQIGLIDSPQEWLFCGLFIIVAIFGKVIGTAVPARMSGESWKNSWLMGALMNTRGLMELIVLTIGYEMEILSPPVFAMLVLMTLITTFMTGPLLSFIERRYRIRQPVAARKQSNRFRILLAFGRAGNGKILLDVAQQVFSKGNRKPEITALHLTVGAEVNPIHTGNFAEVSFAPIREEAQKIGFPIETQYDVANDVGQYITKRINEEGFNFLLVGAGLSMSALPQDVEAARQPNKWFYPGDLLKDKTRQFIEASRAAVGVFVNRNFEQATDVAVILKQPQDAFLFRYAQNLTAFNGAKITVLDLRSERLSPEFLSERNFMLIGYETWMDISEYEKEALQRMPSTLIIRKSI
ncbi:MAG: cation:proton antiporter [Dysgonamonadaceae bacterium]|jgi:Kef-type K+ transport system membrane component KefB|nr:cation:proton antiporter [Dysgonamonadaceae bacterium]